MEPRAGPNLVKFTGEAFIKCKEQSHSLYFILFPIILGGYTHYISQEKRQKTESNAAFQKMKRPPFIQNFFSL